MAKVSSDMIRPFTGEGDVIAWIKKVQLVAKLQKVKDLACFLPLYLEGDALSIYLEMEESEQEDATKIEARLKAAFTDGPFVAYGKLVRMKWGGEQVDVFANEIRRLAGLAGFVGDGLEQVVKLTFVNGFPDNVRVELMQVENVMKLGMSDILVRARVLAASRDTKVVAVAAKPGNFGGYPQTYEGAQNREVCGGSTGETRRGVFRGQCYRCGGPHMAKFCKDKKAITCYRCGKEGHIAIQCSQGNEWRGAAAPAATPSVE